MQRAIGDRDGERGKLLARHLLIAIHGGLRPLVLCQPPIGKVLPHDPDCAEQRRHRPYDVHDPHVLLMANQVRGDDHCARQPEQQEGDRERMKPGGDQAAWLQTNSGTPYAAMLLRISFS